MAIFKNRPFGYVSAGDPPSASLLASGIVNQSWNIASEATNAFDDIILAAVTKVDEQSERDELVVGVANETPVAEPAIVIPSSVTPGDVMSLFDQKYTELVALLVDKFTTFQAQYFPNESANYVLAETWVQNALNNPDHGIPAAIAAQMMTDAKSRAYADASVQSDTVLATFAARGYPLPPGAAASAVLQIAQKSQETVAEASRKLMMAYVEQMRFAVDKAMSMRKESMDAAISYINALASGPSMATGLVNHGFDAQSKLVSATASFYNARTDANRLVKQAEQYNIDRKYSKDERNVSNDIVLTQENLKLLLNEAQALAQIATSLFNNVNVSTSVSV